MWQLRMHCNLRPPDKTPAFSASVTTRSQVWSRWTYPLPYYSVFAADTLLYAVTLTFDLWSWTFAVYRLWLGETLCTEFERKRAIRGGVIAISVFDLMTLNMLRVVLGSDIIFTNFDLRQLIRGWMIAFFWRWYVMSHCNLDLWPLDLELSLHLGCHVFKLCTKFERNRIIHGWGIDDLARFRRAILGDRALLPNGSQGCVDPTLPNVALT